MADSGDGVPEPLRDILFEENVSGHAAGEMANAGWALALVRQVARVVDGDVWLADPGTDSGAVFVARLPGVLASGESRHRAGSLRSGSARRPEPTGSSIWRGDGR